MADLRYKSLNSWKNDNIDLTQHLVCGFSPISVKSINKNHLIATDFYRLTTTGIYARKHGRCEFAARYDPRAVRARRDYKVHRSEQFTPFVSFPFD